MPVEAITVAAEAPVTPELKAAAIAVREAVYGRGHLDSYIEQARYDAVKPAIGMMMVEATKDFAELLTDVSVRRASYRLHRELGFSRFAALRSTSPSGGLAVAAVIPVQRHRKNYWDHRHPSEQCM